MRFAELLDGLTRTQWSQPTLCDGWSVLDVVAHTVVYLGQSLPSLTLNMIRARGDVDRLNARIQPTNLSPAALVDMMIDGGAPTGAGALYGGRVALIECLIHQQDIRRPLGLTSAVPEDALRISLDYARVSPVIGGARRTRGIRLAASDIEWSAGRGPVVSGPAEALLLAMTGRVEAVRAELSGEGLSRLG